jgi:transposase-like protein
MHTPGVRIDVASPWEILCEVWGMLRSVGAPRAARVRNKATESMATTYSPEFKASIIARMLPPNNVPVPKLVRETNIPKDTLYAWRAKARREGQDVAAASAPIYLR